MNINEIKALARLVQDSNLTELEVEEKGIKIRIMGPRPAEIQTFANVLPPAPAPMATLPPATPAAEPTPAAAPPAAEPAAPAASEVPSHWREVKSPMVGTFYRSPAPEADSYVDVGDTVKAESVVCIVEAMKLMNEIKAEMSGTIRKILVENAQPVEFGQPMFLIEPS